MRNEGINKKETTASHKGHMWMMAVCCGLPIIGFIAIAVLGVSMPSLETALLLICPVGMIGMMYMMRRDSCPERKNDAGDKPDIALGNLEYAINPETVGKDQASTIMKSGQRLKG
jgi:hypothetical protein